MGEVLLHYGSTEGNGSNGGAYTHGVIAEAYFSVEYLVQVRDCAQVCVLRDGWIAAGGFEQHGLGAASLSDGLHCIIKFTQCGHAGGGGLFDKGQVIVFKAGDLVGGGAEICQEVDGGFIKRRADADQAPLAGALHDRAVPFPGNVGLLVKIMQVLARPEGIGIADLERAATHVERYRVFNIGLQLDRVGNRLGRCLQDRQVPLQALVVVALISSINKGVVSADRTAGDFDRN